MKALVFGDDAEVHAAGARAAVRQPAARRAGGHADGAARAARPGHPRPRLGRAAAPAHRHLRLRRQAGVHGHGRRRHRLLDDRVHLVPAGAGARGGGRRRRSGSRGARPRARPAASSCSAGCRARPAASIPVCPACAAGDFSLCWNFTAGRLAPGIHTGNSSDATGGFAELHARARVAGDPRTRLVSATRSRCSPTRSRCHSTRSPVIPRRPGGRALVWGRRRARHLGHRDPRRALPDGRRCRSGVCHPAQQALARKLGAHVIAADQSDEELVVALAEWSGATLLEAVGRPAHHPPRTHRRRLRHRRLAAHARGCARGCSRRRHPRGERRARRGPVRVVAVVLPRGQRRRIERVRHRGSRRRAQARAASTTSTSPPTAASTSRRCSRTHFGSTTGATRSRPSPSSTTPARSRWRSTSDEHDATETPPLLPSAPRRTRLRDATTRSRARW